MYLNTEEGEVKVKTELWMELNKEYLELMEIKQQEAAKKPPPKVREKKPSKQTKSDPF